MSVLFVQAQSPKTISYQAILRDNVGVLIQNAPTVAIKVSLIQGNIMDNLVVYEEIHFTTTNPNGLFTIEIGAGTVAFGNYPTIQWGNGPYFLKTEIDPNGGTNYLITAITELLSVPLANYAFEAEKANTLPGEAGGIIGFWTSTNSPDNDFALAIFEYVGPNWFWWNTYEEVFDQNGLSMGFEWQRFELVNIVNGELFFFGSDSGDYGDWSISLENNVLSITVVEDGQTYEWSYTQVE
jgi:hypothetical protein